MLATLDAAAPQAQTRILAEMLLDLTELVKGSMQAGGKGSAHTADTRARAMRPASSPNEDDDDDRHAAGRATCPPGRGPAPRPRPAPREPAPDSSGRHRQASRQAASRHTNRTNLLPPPTQTLTAEHASTSNAPVISSDGGDARRRKDVSLRA